MNRYTVVSRSTSTAPEREMFAGHHEECLLAIDHLIEQRSWPVPSIGLRDDATGKFVAFPQQKGGNRHTGVAQ